VSPAFDRLDALPDTRKVERPRLVSRPMPGAWMPLVGTGMLVHLPTEQTLEDLSDLDDEDLALSETFARDLLALVAWERHERAVRAQEGGR